MIEGEDAMVGGTLAQMTRDELKELIEDAVETAVEQKLLEILGDPDEGLEIRQRVRQRLLYQKQMVASGERGQEMKDVVQELGLG